MCSYNKETNSGQHRFQINVVQMNKKMHWPLDIVKNIFKKCNIYSLCYCFVAAFLHTCVR